MLDDEDVLGTFAVCLAFGDKEVVVEVDMFRARGWPLGDTHDDVGLAVGVDGEGAVKGLLAREMAGEGWIVGKAEVDAPLPRELWEPLEVPSGLRCGDELRLRRGQAWVSCLVLCQCSGSRAKEMAGACAGVARVRAWDLVVAYPRYRPAV